MKLKTKRPNLSKYIPKVLTADALSATMRYVIDTTQRYLTMSPEEREKKLYEDLQKKYDEG